MVKAEDANLILSTHFLPVTTAYIDLHDNTPDVSIHALFACGAVSLHSENEEWPPDTPRDPHAGNWCILAVRVV